MIEKKGKKDIEKEKKRRRRRIRERNKKKRWKLKIKISKMWKHTFMESAGKTYTTGSNQKNWVWEQGKIKKKCVEETNSYDHSGT